MFIVIATCPHGNPTEEAGSAETAAELAEMVRWSFKAVPEPHRETIPGLRWECESGDVWEIVPEVAS